MKWVEIIVAVVQTPPVMAGTFDWFSTSFCVKIVFICLDALCHGNNSVASRTEQHMAAVYDQQPPLRGDWEMLMEQ